MIISNNSLQIPHGISENANFPTNSSWSSSYHVNHYLWLIITFDILEDAKFSKILTEFPFPTRYLIIMLMIISHNSLSKL